MRLLTVGSSRIIFIWRNNFFANMKGKISPLGAYLKLIYRRLMIQLTGGSYLQSCADLISWRDSVGGFGSV